jgi:hypothetical protein
MPANWYELEMEERQRVSGSRLWLYEDEMKDEISDASIEYLSKLPEQLIIGAGRFNILATHFIAPDITGTSKGSPAGRKDFSLHVKLLKKTRCLVGLAGHAHMEGFAVVTKKDYGMYYYRKFNLYNRRQIIVGPPVTRNPGSRGFMILDTSVREFEAISFK